MKWRCLLLFGMVMLLSGAQRSKDVAIKKDKDGLQGTWSIIKVVTDGKTIDVTKLVGAKVIFAGYKASGKVVRLGPGNECTFVIDPTQKPKTINFVHEDRTVTPGIYHLVDSKLKICNASPKQPRPKTFESRARSGHVLINLRRDR